MRYVDRDDFIIQFRRGRRILHLGCVGLADLSVDERVSRFAESLEWRLSREATVIGVDYSADVVAQLRDSCSMVSAAYEPSGRKY